MDKIECQWCKAQNESGQTTCDTCGAPLDEQYKVTDAGWTEVPQLRDLTRFGFSNSTCQIDGGIVPVAELALAAGERRVLRAPRRALEGAEPGDLA